MKVELSSLVPPVIISSLGGLANYLYKTSRGEKFKLFRMVTNIFLAGFLGYIVQGFITPDSKMFGPMLAITGFCAYPILQLVETNGTALIYKFIK